MNRDTADVVDFTRLPLPPAARSVAVASEESGDLDRFAANLKGHGRSVG